MSKKEITLCLTIGKRPELLRQTLESLLNKVDFKHIIAINDFRDEPTNAMFKQLCPHGQLILLPEQVGHHKAVDTMYAQVKTPYILHCEDDWLFDQALDIDTCIQSLENDKNATLLCLRKWTDFDFTDHEISKIKFIQQDPLNVVRLDPLHDQWHAFTFNPHIVSIELWKSLDGGFSNYKKERHISRMFRKQNRYALFLEDGICHHIGEECSIANPPPKNWLQKWKRKIFG
ncbi:glycosyltransferase [Acinetobacter indicus]|uniref:glycosyltransferase n=1 Tax=Acinetobacter indicus TaxID=756892 RepID=UPI000CECA94E|nr:glycosyltransferase [Acinetobacter indicus]MCO8103463.1 glycosyltransferase [Acinetobacter indicus]MDM1243237.1 glycosyltransferase [Acinetobacter indicus]MDM1287467.1 glycosyltransferase [Acinetobacter indicus]